MTKNTNPSRFNSYIASYDYFCKFFKEAKFEEKPELVVVCLYMVYGWMPTILDLKKHDTGTVSLSVDKLRTIGKILDKVKNLNSFEEIFSNGKNEESDFRKLKTFINNSVVGTSKVLHFCNPSVFAVFDSNICNAIFHPKKKPQQPTEKEYRLYLKGLYDLIENIHTPVLKRIFSPEYHSSNSLVRQVEWKIFQMAVSGNDDISLIRDYFKTRLIFYIHGFNSGPKVSKRIELNEVLAARVITLSYDSGACCEDNFNALVSQVHDVLKNVSLPEDVVVIGTSLGGFYAKRIAEHFHVCCIMINPVVDAVEELTRFVGEQTNFVSEKTYRFTEETLLSYKSFRQTSHESPTLIYVSSADELLENNYEKVCAEFEANAFIVETKTSHQVDFKELPDFFARIEALTKEKMAGKSVS